MSEDRVVRLKRALMDYLRLNDRHYGDLSRIEQSVEDLAQALYTRLCQLELEIAGEKVSLSADEERRRDLGDTFRTLGMAAETGLLEEILDRKNLEALSGPEGLGGLASALRKRDLSNFLADSADTDLTLGRIESVEKAMEKKRR